MIEGTSDKVQHNENKGLNWLKEAVKKGHILSIEYKTYWDIRFERRPNLEKIKENLERVIEDTKSPKACNTLAELNHASAGNNNPAALAHLTPEAKEAAEKAKVLAAKYYLTSSEGGDIVGSHWLGVFYHEGFGVNKNVTKAVELLEKAAKEGNG
jgi:TPR repeat protein